jgi:hypothetical protein
MALAAVAMAAAKVKRITTQKQVFGTTPNGIASWSLIWKAVLTDGQSR